MKKVVPTLLLTIAMLIGKAQTSRTLWFNELIPNPGNGDNEYVEFYNSSRDAIQLDCYVVVSYFKTQGQGNNSEEGVYIYDFPTGDAIQGLSRYLVSSANTVNYKGNNNIQTSYTPEDPSSNFSNWNAPGAGGSLLKYLYYNSNNNKSWGTSESLPVDFNDFMDDAYGMDATLMLFKISNGVAYFENGFIVNPPNSSVSTMITHLQSLPLLNIMPSGSCGSSSVNIDFGTITNNNIDIISLNEAPGRGQGYAKQRDGLCGNWEKTAQGQFSPGTTNNFGTATSSLNTLESFSCSTVSFSISPNTSTTYPISVQLFYDNPTTSILEATDGYINEHSVGSSAQASNTFNVANSNQPVLLAYQSSTGCFDKIVSLKSSCSVLPVRFRSFTATRNKQKKEQVELKWETSSEQNNRGFKVQRKTSGEWKDIAFVPTQTKEGNSSALLSYVYADNNTYYNASQYRLQQVDIDGKSDFSDVRTVLGTDQPGSVLIYPNPGINGKVNLIFKDHNAMKHVMVNDASGRLIRQFPQVRDNSLTIEGLPKGFYTIKIIDRSTMATAVEKVIIN